ncbi:MAG: 5'-methylthioadenosine nucleosidase [Candidatus Igneacidithiobacillus chanchocoensis]
MALATEAQALGVGVHDPRRVQAYAGNNYAILAGMGPEAARSAASALVAAGAQALLSIGTAGALREDFHAGDLLIPEAILWEGAEYPTNPRLAQRFRAHFPAAPRGALLTLAAPLATPATKAQAAAQALAVDMESGAIAALAQELGMPFLALRVIVDSADSRLPQAVLRGVDAFGRPRLPGFVWQLSRRPQDIPALLRLGRQMQAAAATLRHLRGPLQGRAEQCVL